ncbi:MAG: hypothetical protein CSB44_00030 [Gammaproteobacteria bacterium]|nr:MAG: hypothetical protein CSB44_00030 [Gammaproteobacteria bacterium]
MNTFVRIAIVTVATGTLLVSAAAFAVRGGEARFGARMIENVSEQLSLDANQREALDGLRTEFLEMREALRGEGNMRDTLLEMATADTFDQGAALAMLNTRAEAVQTHAPDLVAAAALFFDGLDAEQKARMTEMAERFDERGRHGHRGMGCHDRIGHDRGHGNDHGQDHGRNHGDGHEHDPGQDHVNSHGRGQDQGRDHEHRQDSN